MFSCLTRLYNFVQKFARIAEISTEVTGKLGGLTCNVHRAQANENKHWRLHRQVVNYIQLES